MGAYPFMPPFFRKKVEGFLYKLLQKDAYRDMRHFVINDFDMRPFIRIMHVKCVLFLRTDIFKVTIIGTIKKREKKDSRRTSVRKDGNTCKY